MRTRSPLRTGISFSDAGYKIQYGPVFAHIGAYLFNAFKSSLIIILLTEDSWASIRRFTILLRRNIESISIRLSNCDNLSDTDTTPPSCANIKFQIILHCLNAAAPIIPASFFNAAVLTDLNGASLSLRGFIRLSPSFESPPEIRIASGSNMLISVFKPAAR